MPLQVNPNLKEIVEVPDDCLVYLYYIPGIQDNKALKDSLNDFGEQSGKNVYVGLWRKDATDLQETLSQFKVKSSPAVVIFGNPNSTEEYNSGVVYAKINDQKLLNNLPMALDVINQTCNLFIQGDVNNAVKNAKSKVWRIKISDALKNLKTRIAKFLDNHSVTFDFTQGIRIIVAPSSTSEGGSRQ